MIYCKQSCFSAVFLTSKRTSYCCKSTWACSSEAVQEFNFMKDIEKLEPHDLIKFNYCSNIAYMRCLFTASLCPYSKQSVLCSLHKEPFIFRDIWRLKGPCFSNDYIIVGRGFVEANYSIVDVVREFLLTLLIFVLWMLEKLGLQMCWLTYSLQVCKSLIITLIAPLDS